LKHKFKDARDRQLGLQKELTQAQRPVVSYPPRFAVRETLSKDMELVFRSQKHLCEALDITAKTWRDLKSSEEGVREGTAYRVVIDFISLLRKIAQGKLAAPPSIQDELVAGLDEKYSAYLSNRKFDDLVNRVDPPATE